MNGSQYEREFRSILEADEAMLQKITKSCSALERENYFNVVNKPFAVIRAAGSLGIDLVAVRGDVSFLIEIKTSSASTLHFSSMSGKLQDQAESMKQLCEKTATLPVYAFRLKRYRGDSWRIFTLDHSKLQGRLRIVHHRLPTLSQSSNGNYIMRWDDGMPLSDFLNYICKQ
ncbi:MAG: Holliday junction resolvase [Candidatus Thermoplasmatota archaeon]|nr:Holliday junction resolvase [Candidatus Thermoplasmatota archaeon]MBS3802166.1 Holliday junction resolvase [Candidatus Thermoplasmatota archaeon]